MKNMKKGFNLLCILIIWSASLFAMEPSTDAEELYNELTIPNSESLSNLLAFFRNIIKPEVSPLDYDFIISEDKKSVLVNLRYGTKEFNYKLTVEGQNIIATNIQEELDFNRALKNNGWSSYIARYPSSIIKREKEIPQSKELWEKALDIEPGLIFYAPTYSQNEKRWIKAVNANLVSLDQIPKEFSELTFIALIKMDPYKIYNIPHKLRTYQMWALAIQKEPSIFCDTKKEVMPDVKNLGKVAIDTYVELLKDPVTEKLAKENLNTIINLHPNLKKYVRRKLKGKSGVFK